MTANEADCLQEKLFFGQITAHIRLVIGIAEDAISALLKLHPTVINDIKTHLMAEGKIHNSCD